MNTYRPICTAVPGGGITTGFRNKEDEEYDSDDFKPISSPPVNKHVGKRKTTTRFQNPKPIRDQRAAPSLSTPLPNQAELPTAARLEQVDLTRSEDAANIVSSKTGNHFSHPIQATTTAASNSKLDMDAQKAPIGINKSSEAGNSPSKEMDPAAALASDDPILDITPLSDEHETEFLSQARLQFTSEQPPFVRLDKKGAPKMVTLAIGGGELPKTAVVATLVTRMWDSKLSYYTLDLNGERVIVKPFGGISAHGERGGNPYRKWSGQGKAFDHTPIAFSFKGETEAKPWDRKDFEDDLESDFVDVSLKDSDPQDDDDYLSTTSGALDLESEKSTTETALPEFPMTRGRQAQLNVNCDDGDTRCPNDALMDEIEPRPSHNSSEPSNAAPEISAVAAGKRRASDTSEYDRSPKKARQVRTNTSVASNDTARIPPTLTSYKQERTTLHVLVPGSTSEKVPIKLRSAMTISTLFSSVRAAARVGEHGCNAIAVMLKGKDGGQDEIIRVNRDILDTFEFFLEVIDEASCWDEEGGRMVLQLQLR